MRSLLLTDAIALASIIYFLMPTPAHAYFDLGTGTYLVQLFFAFTAAFWFSFRKTIKQTFFKPKVLSASDESISDSTGSGGETKEAG